MSLSKKYNYNINDMEIVKTLPTNLTKYIYIVREDEKNYFNDILYKNDFGNPVIVAYKEDSLYSILLFLKKYRKNPELLPRDLQHEYPYNDMSSEEIYKAMKLMLKPMNSLEEFKERLLLATEELASVVNRNEYITRFGEKLVFVNKKEDFGNAINIYGELIPVLKKYNESYWEEAILFDKEKKIFEYWYKKERTNDTPDRSNWGLHIKFYEEQYLYEYLLNQEISAVKN